MPRLSSSPHLPQLPRLPHLPGTVQGAGSFASLSSSGYCGACWALTTPSHKKTTPTARLPKPTSSNFRRSIACSSSESFRALYTGAGGVPPPVLVWVTSVWREVHLTVYYPSTSSLIASHDLVK